MSDDELRAELRVAIATFESGCSNDGHLEGEPKRPETCPECVRAFVNHVTKLAELTPTEALNLFCRRDIAEMVSQASKVSGKFGE